MCEDAKTNKQLLRERKDKCCICGETTYCCLEMHHIRNKLYTISQAVKHLPLRLFIEELNKCITVCSNCHKKLHKGLIMYEDN